MLQHTKINSLCLLSLCNTVRHHFLG